MKPESVSGKSDVLPLPTQKKNTVNNIKFKKSEN